MRIAIVVLCGGIAASVSAQSFHVVGPGALAQIRDALAVAAPGDVVDVLPGTYAHFTASFGVTIRAVAPHSVSIAYDPAFAPPGCLTNPFCGLAEGPTVFAAPVGQTVYVSGVDFTASTYSSGSLLLPLIKHRVVVSSGSVSFDDCHFSAFETSALRVQSASVHLQNCVVAGTGFNATAHGLSASAAHLTAVATSFAGNGGTGFVFPGDAITMTTSTLKASGCSMFGGTQLLGGVGGAALRVGAADRVWIRDSSLVGGGTTCAVVGTPLVGRAQNTTYAPAGSCAALPNGPVVGAVRSGPLVGGTTITAQFLTEPFEAVLLFAAHGLETTEIGGIVEQPLALEASTRVILGTFAADANGDFSASWFLPPGILNGVPLWVGAATFGTSPLIQIAPTLGGVVLN
jgi:hypothetical protein